MWRLLLSIFLLPQTLFALESFEVIAKEEGVPPKLLAAICWVESRHNPKAINQYDGGSPSYGICQIKLTTAQLVGFKGSVKELLNKKTNITYAAKYLAYQLKRYNGDWKKAVTAYNKGVFLGTEKNTKYVTKVLFAAAELGYVF